MLVAGTLLATAGTLPSSARAVVQPPPGELARSTAPDTAREAPRSTAQETVGDVAEPLGGVAPVTILASDIAPFDVTYDVGNNLVTAGTAKLSFRRDGDAWVYTLSTRPTGVFKLTGKGRIRETSVIDVVRSGDTVQLQPKTYTYRQDEERRRRVDAAFDWDARQLSWARREEAATETFEEPVLDRLSVTLAVMHALREGFEEIELAVFDKDEIKTMRFVNEGNETLETTMGRVETIRVRTENVAGSSRSTKTWFAPSLDYVPVRIEQHKRGELVARLSLTRLKNRITDLELDVAEE